MDKDYFAKECEFLGKHEVLNFILDKMRTESVDAVLSANPTDYAAIADAQAKANAVDHIRTLIAVGAKAKSEEPGFAPV